jgi:Na+-translocating ferredoxin:NAD+ oxidoreductase RnfG subunit
MKSRARRCACASASSCDGAAHVRKACVMDAKFFLIPAAALAIAVPAHATVYMSVEQAQQLMFPGETLTPHPVTLSDAQTSRIEDVSDSNIRSNTLQAWKASSGGWFIVDQVIGKHDTIPIALGIDAHGAVKDIEILEYRESYGGEVRNPKWRAQFTGKTHASKLKLTEDIKNISGATLSSKHITDGVRRLLATYDIALANH